MNIRKKIDVQAPLLIVADVVARKPSSSSMTTTLMEMASQSRRATVTRAREDTPINLPLNNNENGTSAIQTTTVAVNAEHGNGKVNSFTKTTTQMTLRPLKLTNGAAASQKDIAVRTRD